MAGEEEEEAEAERVGCEVAGLAAKGSNKVEADEEAPVAPSPSSPCGVGCSGKEKEEAEDVAEAVWRSGAKVVGRVGPREEPLR